MCFSNNDTPQLFILPSRDAELYDRYFGIAPSIGEHYNSQSKMATLCRLCGRKPANISTVARVITARYATFCEYLSFDKG